VRLAPHCLLVPAVLGLVLAGCAGVRPPVAERVRVRTSRATSHYLIHGTTSRAIFDEIAGNHLFDTNGRPAVGVTAGRWSIDWHGVEPRPGVCEPSPLTITLALEVTLPEHERPEALSEALRARWQRFAARVEAHEQRHVDIYLDGARAMKARMEEVLARWWPSCAELRERIRAVWAAQEAETERAKDRFHEEDDAEIQRERHPLQARIDANQARLAAMLADIGALNREVGDLERRLDATRAGIDTAVAELAAAGASLASCARPGVAAAVVTLCQRHNALVADHNATVAKHNEVVARQNALAAEHWTR
jgi:predicted secreted Zn-dependent protease